MIPADNLMAHAVSLPGGGVSEHRGLAYWMKRALDEVDELRSGAESEAVHDVRVALRRCRSIAAAMEEIDPHPDWQEMRACAKKLFASLGELRDAQVMADWLKQLQPDDDPWKHQWLETLAAKEKAAGEKAQRRATRFDQKQWKRLSRALSSRLRRVPLDGDAAHCLALERLDEAKELHRRAMRTEDSKPWHALRIGVKHFRYTVEALLPSAHAQWSDSLKRTQDFLGNIHDLDVLADMLQKTSAGQAGETVTQWQGKIAAQRQSNVEAYRQMALGASSIWTSWLSAFPRSEWERYANARIRATRSAMDAKPARSQVVRRMAVRLWSQLRACQAAEVFSDRKERRVMEAAAQLIGVRNGDLGKSREKSARTFLLKSPVPPQWTFAEWERVAWAIRFQRGTEPGSGNRRFSRLAVEQQSKICLLSGVLRLALALQRTGLSTISSLRMQASPQGLLFHVTGIEDNAKNAARLTEGKRLLERSLGKAILVQVEPESAAAQEQTLATSTPPPLEIVR